MISCLGNEFSSEVRPTKRAADGWHWDTGGTMDNQPWGWLYDASYEEQLQFLREHPEYKEPRDKSSSEKMAQRLLNYQA